METIKLGRGTLEFERADGRVFTLDILAAAEAYQEAYMKHGEDKSKVLLDYAEWISKASGEPGISSFEAGTVCVEVLCRAEKLQEEVDGLKKKLDERLASPSSLESMDSDSAKPKSSSSTPTSPTCEQSESGTTENPEGNSLHQGSTT